MSNIDKGREASVFGSCCYQYQKHLEQDLCGLAFQVMDMSSTKRGMRHIMELLRRLVEWRGIDEMRSPEMVKSLARVADFQDTLHEALETASDEMTKRDVTALDGLLDHYMAMEHLAFLDAEQDTVVSQSFLVNDILKKAGFHNNVAKQYPVVYLSLLDCIRAATTMGSCWKLQLLITRLFERSFCRLQTFVLDTWNQNAHKGRSAFVSHVACILDFSGVPIFSVADGYMFRIIEAVMEVVWVLAPLFLHAIVFHQLCTAQEYLWRWLQMDQDAISLSSVRIRVTTTIDELDQLLATYKYPTTLGGFQDTSLQHYTCDQGKSIPQGLLANPFRDDEFWQRCGAVREARRKTLEEVKKGCGPNDVQGKEPQSLFCSKTRYKSNVSSSLPSCYNLDEVSCSAHLVHLAEETYTTMCDVLDKENEATRFKDYIKTAAIMHQVPLTSSYRSKLPDHTVSQVKTNATMIPPSIRHTSNVCRPSSRICCWRKKMYRDLVFSNVSCCSHPRITRDT